MMIPPRFRLVAVLSVTHALVCCVILGLASFNDTSDLLPIYLVFIDFPASLISVYLLNVLLTLVPTSPMSQFLAGCAAFLSVGTVWAFSIGYALQRLWSFASSPSSGPMKK
jgi:hypothetical protein